VFWQGEFLDRHRYTKGIVTTFLPTVLVTLLALLVPLLLLLITTKGHAILTRSKMADSITTRYYKFLVCKYVLVPSILFN
jgi:hypothetical protein